MASISKQSVNGKACPTTTEST